MLSSTLRLNFCYLKIIHILHPRYHHPEIIRYTLQNKQKNLYVYIHEIIRVIVMKIKMKMKKRSHRYDINRPTSRHEQKYSKYKKYLSMMMLLCIKQHLINIWSSIHEKVKLTLRLSWKKALLIKKKACSFLFQNICYIRALWLRDDLLSGITNSILWATCGNWYFLLLVHSN